MLRNIALHIAYDGTFFHGYQVQPAQRTVQGDLEKGLVELLGHPCQTFCAGRTDAGVHAKAQLVNFFTAHNLPLERFVPALQRLLPSDIAVWNSYQLPLEFHARYRAIVRHYRYLISYRERYDPFTRNTMWWSPQAFDPKLFKTIWDQLPGQRNCHAFCKSGSYRKNFILNIRETQCTFKDSVLTCDIIAESFLYNMARTLVGTVWDIARGHLPPDHIHGLFRHPERHMVGLTVPPHGLCLYNVIYPEHYQIQLLPRWKLKEEDTVSSFHRAD